MNYIHPLTRIGMIDNLRWFENVMQYLAVLRRCTPQILQKSVC